MAHKSVKSVLLLLLLTLASYSCPVAAQVGPKYDALVHLGNAQLQAAKLDQALASGEEAIRLNPGRWEAYALSGGALMNLKRYEEAADSFSKAIDKAPVSKQSALRDLRKQCVLAEGAVSPSTSAPITTSAQTSPVTTRAEVVLWKSIETSKEQADFQVYLSQYPNGTFAALAREHIDQLKAEQDRLQAEQDRVRQERAVQAKMLLEAGVTYQDCYTEDDQGTVNVSPAGVRTSGDKRKPSVTLACLDIEKWKVSGDHYSITIRAKSTGKNLIVCPMLRVTPVKNGDSWQKNGWDRGGDDFAAHLVTYCGS